MVTGSTDRTPSVHPLEGVAPIIAFLVAYRLSGVRAAVAVATVLAIVTAWRRRRAGLRTGWIVAALTIGLIARGVAAIITNSEDVYFGIGIGARMLFGLALLLSPLVGRPLAARAATSALGPSPAQQSHPAWRQTMVTLSVIAGLYFVTSASLELFLYQRSSVEGFVVLRLLANWPLAVAAITLALALAQRQLGAIPGFGSLQERIEAQLALQHPPGSGTRQ